MKKNSNKANKTKELFKKIVEGVTNIIVSGEYEEFLKFSKNFHQYSFNNIILIYSQMKEATQVAGFKKWQAMGRKLKKGVHGIQIIYPIKRKYTKIIEGQDSLKDENKKEEIEYLMYRYTYVYDISQTVGKPLPIVNKFLNSDNKEELYDFLKAFSPYKIEEDDIFGNAKGYWFDKEQKIIKKIGIYQRHLLNQLHTL